MMAIEQHYLDELTWCTAATDLSRATILAALRFLTARDQVRQRTLARRFKIRRYQAARIAFLARELHLSWYATRRGVYRIQRGAFRRVLELGALVEREGLQ